ncbi:hypothetical protein KSD_47650 [Ktedonobacter sp. SOSP1-85]|uniref:hypothetical protein n=1 Tax=Ktedonobacter sp. SOSP1-85 TaxID=2778367 RepID=UPI0019165CFE|nr:hypothetical protein [Ktedonobacter sp. SOSP1-85]GHO76994.1 hypothetical protein KSD_47650 [Ktedonobacter sp. SOSP1-85]
MSKQLQRPPSAATQESDLWLQHLQRRVMLLLLRHDQKLFQGQFRTFYVGSSLPTLPLLQFYDRYLKLQLFSAELLDDILPRVRRQWSLQTSQLALNEEAPVRGEIDWSRTIARTLAEAPDQPPLRFDTRLRQQSMHIPENVLVVAILLRYRQLVQGTLRDDQREEMLTSQERQQLVSLDERLERELATPHTRALAEDARKADLDTLMPQVSAQLRPGSNPYRDLMAWWEQVSSLYIGATGNSADQQRHLTLLSRRRDAQMAQWLYELWLALELLTFFQEMPEAQLSDVEVSCNQLRWRFTWQERRFHFHFQRQLSPSNDGEASAWQNIPVSQPSFTIMREHPLKVEHKGTLIWKEPPFVLSAVYPAPEQAEARLGEAIQRLLGLMQVQRAPQGALCCPIVAAPEPGQQISGTVRPDERQYVNSASVHTSLTLYKLTPDLPGDRLQERLRAILDQAIASLPERAAPACHGFMLDVDSINDSNDRLQEFDTVCPKPHIGPGIFDLVHSNHHCGRDPRVCHIVGQVALPPRVVRVLNMDDLKLQIDKLREYGAASLLQISDADHENVAEQLSSQILQSVGTMVEQYFEKHGDVQSQEKYLREVFGDYWKHQSRSLAEETRHILLSGEYVWDEYEKSGLKDWAAPAIQYCRALEREIKHRIYAPKRFDYTIKEKSWTLGTPKRLYEHRKDVRGDDRSNWDLMVEVASLSGVSPKDFETVMKRLYDEQVSNARNDLAHGKPIDKQRARKLREIIIGHKGNGILCWIAENLDPAREPY